MKKWGDLSDFKCSINTSAAISEYIRNYWPTGIFTHCHLWGLETISRKKRKYPVSGSFLGWHQKSEVDS